MPVFLRVRMWRLHRKATARVAVPPPRHWAPVMGAGGCGCADSSFFMHKGTISTTFFFFWKGGSSSTSDVTLRRCSHWPPITFPFAGQSGTDRTSRCCLRRHHISSLGSKCHIQRKQTAETGTRLLRGRAASRGSLRQRLPSVRVGKFFFIHVSFAFARTFRSTWPNLCGGRCWLLQGWPQAAVFPVR